MGRVTSRIAPVLVGAALAIACREQGSAEFVGEVACAGCHAAEAAAWHGSDHDRAMEVAGADTVLGDFSGAAAGFHRSGDGYFVRADGPDGNVADYRVAYTFGVEPLQQYLVEFPRGRYQALRQCWDTRPAFAGGQRWFELYPGETIDHDDPLHWTGPQQNWNYMCAECHSTGLERGYDAAEDRLETTWAEIDVSCEACHGPGSRHVAWAQRERRGRPDEDPTRGLAVILGDATEGAWAFDGVRPTAHRSPPRSSYAEIETCARCHSRRGWVWEDYRFGAPIADTHRVPLLEPGLYHDDGQILDEVYEYGSFLQSRMHAEGVTCSDCHDPHSTRTTLDGNALCGRCHAPAVFDTAAHHRHAPGTEGSRCVDCHMPVRSYMVVDPRRDHSFRVPRPDLAVELGVPEPCSACHAGRDARWAAHTVASWYPDGRSGRFHYGEALHAARSSAPEAPELLERVFEDANQPAIVRATALLEMRRAPGARVAATIERAATDPSPLVRRTAAEFAEAIDSSSRVRVAAPLLDDPIRTVRLAAASTLAGAPPEVLGPDRAAALERAIAEVRESLRFDEFRAEAQYNLGNLERQLGRAAESEAAYRKSLDLDPSFVPAYVNLADLLAASERESDAADVLRRGLARYDGSPEMHHALGLALARGRQYAEALEHLRVASELQPQNPRHAFVYGVALHDTGDVRGAVQVLAAAERLHPNDSSIREALRAYRAEEASAP